MVPVTALLLSHKNCPSPSPCLQTAGGKADCWGSGVGCRGSRTLEGGRRGSHWLRAPGSGELVQPVSLQVSLQGWGWGVFTCQATCSSSSAVYQKCQPIKGNKKVITGSRDCLSSGAQSAPLAPFLGLGEGAPCAQSLEPAGSAMVAPSRAGQGCCHLGRSPAVPGAVPDARGLAPWTLSPGVPSGVFRVAAGSLVAIEGALVTETPPPSVKATHIAVTPSA